MPSTNNAANHSGNTASQPAIAAMTASEVAARMNSLERAYFQGPAFSYDRPLNSGDDDWLRTFRRAQQEIRARELDPEQNIGKCSKLGWSVLISYNNPRKATLKLGRYGFRTKEEAISHQLETLTSELASTLREMNGLMESIGRMKPAIASVKQLASELATKSNTEPAS